MNRILFFLIFTLFVSTLGSCKTINLQQNEAKQLVAKPLDEKELELSSFEKEMETNSLGMNFVKIEPGEFAMGSNQGEFDENPVHLVKISSAFYVSNTPVTNAQYEKFDPNHKLLRGKRGLSYYDDEAVVFVTWHDAIAFTEWLSQREGKYYRLPTEAEWEYACRAGTTTKFCTGDSLPEIYHLNQKGEWYPKPVSLTVGKTPANPWGLYNLHGLVEEWCMDWYGPYIDKAQTDPVGYVDGDSKVCRGGSHNAKIEFLRSANRLGMLPDDKNCLVGFRIVQAEMPKTKAQAITNDKQWATDISQSDWNWQLRKDKEKPYLEKPIYFQNVQPGSNGPLYASHNHCPDITTLPNGDIFTTWYSTNTEDGREMAVVASRLRKGATEWDEPSLFYKIPDRNMHATAIWWDKSGKRIYHFQGVGVSQGWGDLALFMRISEDNCASWSKPYWINPEHGLHNMPIAGIIKLADGTIVVPCDAVTGGEGGSAIHISKDGGISWSDPGLEASKPTFEEGESGGLIAGIHAGVVGLKDGSLLALGRGNNINGDMPMSISSDMGKTWAYSASPFPPISSGQRLVLMRLNEGPLFFASFTGPHKDEEGMEFTKTEGGIFRGYGLYVALSFDEGKTWPIRKLLSPGEGEYDGGAWTQLFKTDATHAEPRGYLAGTQAPDNTIHLISSKLHYRFNLAWLNEN